MTGPEDSHAGTRPISVAELLAKNGTIGAPPVGGRRRRRRGNADAVTVAELTGEIPVITDDLPADEPAEPEPEPRPAVSVTDTTVIAPVVMPPAARFPGRNGTDAAADFARTDAAADFARTDAETDYDEHLQARDADPDPVEFVSKPRRAPYPSAKRTYQPTGTGAERMSPDPLDDIRGGGAADLAESTAAEHDDVDIDDADDRESYRRSPLGPLFGGESMADDLAQRDLGAGDDLIEGADEFDDFDDFDEPDVEPESSPLLRGFWVVGQCVVAVAFGAGLFVAFDQLWKWNTIVALVLGVLVILGLAGGVRVVRKTEDIGSTLTAVAVGAMVTFGPLALLHAS